MCRHRAAAAEKRQRTKAAKEQLRMRLALRASGATTPYENKYRTETRPGKTNRRNQRLRAIQEQD
jgi:hypothetical protein